MLRELLALVAVAAVVLLVLVGRPSAGASWLTAERLGAPVRFRGVVHGEARIEEAEDGWRRVVVELATREDAARGRSPVDLILLVDTSNSMRRGGRMARAKAWAGALAGALREGDRLALVGFDRDPEVLLPPGPPREVGSLLEGIRPAGPTDLGAGLLRAGQLVGPAPGRVRRLVVLSGGPPNHGLRLDELAARDPPSSVPVLVDLEGEALRRLARAWGGRHRSAREPGVAEAEEVLAARLYAVRNLRIRALGAVASRLSFQEGQGHLIVGGGSLGELAPGERRRLVANFSEPGRSLRGPLGLQLSYEVPAAAGWTAAEEGGTLEL